MKADTYTKQGGYIAIISAIVISIVLIAITFTLSFSGFFLRFNILGNEYKKVSYALAEGCVNTARVKLANDSAYNPSNEQIILGPDRECTIVSRNGSTIRTQAEYQDAFTNLEVDVNLSDTNLPPISWIELANF